MNLYDLMKKSGIVLSDQLDESWNNVDVLGITDDSRKVLPGYLFVAIRGLERDGHSYISKAVESGAVAIIYEIGHIVQDRKYVAVKSSNSRRALGLLWSAWYDFPSSKMKVIGITGTDGKTTTTNLLYHILSAAGRKVGMISTINARFGNKELDTGFHVTNPGPELLQKLLSDMVSEGLEYVCLEVTSHGIDQERVAGVRFLGAVITNVTHEHLDYHKTYEDYLRTKGKLFKSVSFSVINRDDSSFRYLNDAVEGEVLTYGQNESADFIMQNIQLFDDGSSFSIFHRGRPAIDVKLRIPGIYNISNSLAAYTVALKLGITPKEIKSGLEGFSGLEGRFEEIKMGQPFKFIVDFAHTPNALEQVLEQIINHKFQNTKVICVFGCAGERDKEKRQMMGEISGRLADMTVITAEDPRREDLNEIIEKISIGCRKSGDRETSTLDRSAGGHKFTRVTDRREAINFAINLAHPGDIVVVTGKGHEKSMCFGTTETSWSDQAVAKELLGGKYGS